MDYLMARASFSFRSLLRASRSQCSTHPTSRRHLASAAPAAAPPEPVEPPADILSIQPLSPSIGALIHLPSLSPLSGPTTSLLHQLFLRHSIIVLRPESPQPLSPSAFLSIASTFGQPQSYPFLPGISPSHPSIIRVMKQPWETTNFGGIWHSDTTYLSTPPKATVLMAEEIPGSGGGDTLFANQHLALAGLSPALQQVLSGLNAVSTSAKADTSKTREDRIKDTAKPGGGDNDASSSSQPDVHEATHPVVRTNDETGRKSLYVNVAHTARFDGWTEAESAPLLQYLHQQQIKNEYVCRHKWRVGDVAVWDNRCVLHYPINDYQGERRSMLRTTLQGVQPF